MARTASEIVIRATQIAKVPGMTVQAGQILNEVLEELAQTYDMAINITFTTITLTPSALNGGLGPYNLPTDYLRACSTDLYYTISGIPYKMIHMPLDQYHNLDTSSGLVDYPKYYTTSVSQQIAQPELFVWPAPVTTITLNIDYYNQPVDIVAPEQSATDPWFPNDTYLIYRVAGELMRIAGDPRADAMLGDGPSGALGILRRWLNLQGDKEDVAQSAILDPRYFGSGGKIFPPSKVTGGV